MRKPGALRRIPGAIVGVAILCAAVPFGCGKRAESPAAGAEGTPGARSKKATLVFAAYTTPREAYGKAVIPAFQRFWKEKTGQEVEFQESYQASGAQSRAIVGGFEADIAALSLEADIDRIDEAGLIRHDWRAQPQGGMVTSSIVVLAVRQGNPKQVKDWPDLTRAGLNILTPDPKTSGGAQWNINAMYGAALRGEAGTPKGDPAAALAFLTAVFKNVSIMDKGARESITNFEKGVGDVAVTYENEIVIGKKAGQTYEQVTPRSTILIENPVAVIDANVDRHGNREVALAFRDFLWSAEAQRAYAEHGLRPLDAAVAAETAARFPRVPDLWKVDFLGGWKKVAQDIYGPEGVFTRALGAAKGG